MDTTTKSPTTRTLAMHADTNSAGDIFGGWVLSQMDIAAGICAGQRAQGRVVTAAIAAMSFIKPVHVGDILGVFTTVVELYKDRHRKKGVRLNTGVKDIQVEVILGAN